LRDTYALGADSIAPYQFTKHLQCNSASGALGSSWNTGGLPTFSSYHLIFTELKADRKNRTESFGITPCGTVEAQFGHTPWNVDATNSIEQHPMEVRFSQNSETPRFFA
jgi:hypothetical protein